MKVIGLTGGIATGKSSVAAILRVQGFPVIDADRVARDVVASGSPVLAQIAQSFGRDVIAPDGSLDRARLGEKVFAQATLLKQLNGITHPAILAQIQKELTALERAGIKIAFLEVPLLYESGMDKLCQAVIVVKAHPDVQLQRLRERSGLDAEACKSRIRSQWPEDKKTSLATYTIDNSGHIIQTETALKEIIRAIQSKTP